jgi:hypothetical protein
MFGIALTSICGAAMAEVTLFEQLPGARDIRAQDATGSIPGARHADNFSFSEPVEVTSIQWWGSYIPPDLESPTSLDNFSVTFFADGTNLSGESAPGDVLFEQAVSVSAVDTGVDIASVVDQYLYTATLSTPIVFEANQQYWFHPLNDTGLTASDGSWGWEPTAPQAGASWAFFNLGLANLGWRIEDDQSSNMAFRLNGNVIPAPSALAIFGAAGLAAARRRR